jgi:hypothetical protein
MEVTRSLWNVATFAAWKEPPHHSWCISPTFHSRGRVGCDLWARLRKHNHYTSTSWSMITRAHCSMPEGIFKTDTAIIWDCSCVGVCERQILGFLLTFVFKLLLLYTMQKSSRLKRELENITKNPPPGISCVQKEDSLDVLDASKSRTSTTTGYE